MHFSIYSKINDFRYLQDEKLLQNQLYVFSVNIEIQHYKILPERLKKAIEFIIILLIH